MYDRKVQQNTNLTSNTGAGRQLGKGNKTRNMRIEGLRLFAIVGISLFHVLLAWTWLITAQSPEPLLTYGGLSDSLAAQLCEAQAPFSPAVRALTAMVIGLALQLGSIGNHIFFMISGLFILPSAMRASRGARFWRNTARVTARRFATIVVSVIFVACVAFVARVLGAYLPNATILWQWTLGLEFIWVYALFVLLTPLIAWILARFDRRLATVLLSVVTFIVVCANFYIAFLDTSNNRSLTDWRKWMSMVTYAVGFVWAGLLGDSPARTSAQLPATRRVCRTVLWGSVALLIVVQAVFLACNPAGILRLSYKSTSFAAGIIAFSLVALCSLSPSQKHGQRWQEAARSAVPSSNEQSAGNKTTREQSIREQSTTIQSYEKYPTVKQLSGKVSPAEIRSQTSRRSRYNTLLPRLAQGILGFYIVQSVFSTAIMDLGINHWLAVTFASAYISFGEIIAILVLLLSAVLLSVGYVAVVLLVDSVTRQPLLKVLHLS